MNKESWQELMKNEYAIPGGHSADELTAELFSYLGNTDPELRDEIGYIVYANWLKMGLYSQETIAAHISELSRNLEKGIGEHETDSVFIRAFSVLFLAEIVHNDNKAPKLDKATIEALVDKALWYLEHEIDPRGSIPVKGWAHALAHTADLLAVLAKNRHTDAGQHLRILYGITEKLSKASDWVYVHGEDDRLSTVVLFILQRGLLGKDDIQDWLANFTKSWKGAWMDEERTRAFFNVRNFLRSLYLQVSTEEELENKEELENLILNGVQGFRPW